MFAPLNEDLNPERLKDIAREKKILTKLYYNYFLNRKPESILNFKLENEENKIFYNLIKENVLFNVVRGKNKKVKLDVGEVIQFKRVLLEYIDKLIDEKEFIKASKLLNVAKRENYCCNKFYKLKERIRREYFYTGGEV